MDSAIIVTQEINEIKLAYGIRDSEGFLLFFPKISKYDGQDERYEREVKKQNDLAVMLATAINIQRDFCWRFLNNH